MSKPTLSDAVNQGSRRRKNVEKAKEAATGRESQATKRLNVNVPEPLYEEFKHRCEAEGRSLTWVVTQFMEEYVSADK